MFLFYSRHFDAFFILFCPLRFPCWRVAADWWLWTGKAAGSRKKVLAAKSLRCFLQVWCMEGGARGLDCPLVPSVLWESSLQLVDILRGETSIIPRAAPRHYNNLDRHQSLLSLTSTDHSLYCYYTEIKLTELQIKFSMCPNPSTHHQLVTLCGRCPCKGANKSCFTFN